MSILFKKKDILKILFFSTHIFLYFVFGLIEKLKKSNTQYFLVKKKHLLILIC